jgi:hypothetical protein
MSLPKYTFGIQKSFHFDGFEFYMLKWDDYDGLTVPKKYGLSINGWIECPENTGIMPLLIKYEDLIALAGELWDHKIKPPEFFNSIGQQNATEKHLEDMRKIAFNKLKIEISKN